MVKADSVHSTPPLNTPIDPIRYKILLTAMRKIAWPMLTLREEAKGAPDFDEAAARQLANDANYLKDIAEAALEEIIGVDPPATPLVDPIHAAIEAHRQAYVAYDEVAEGPDDENEAAFDELDRASQLLMRAEATTLAGLLALLGYVAPLLQDAGAPGFPVEIPFAGRWSAAYGTFCANVAGCLAAIVANEAPAPAALPPDVDRVANAIVEATAPLIEDFEVARRAARAAIEAMAS